MNPAGAMGTFIRTWRAQWAGLSRAQVAIAVNAQPDNKRRVSEASVRRWEEGQPPKTTAELEALCQVMRAHSLYPIDVRHFQRSVFAACADRHFPELFANDEWLHRDDIDVLAQAVAERSGWSDPSLSVVDLVASVEELKQALRADHRPRPSPAQRQRQRLALLSVRTALARATADPGRHLGAYAARLCREQADLLEEHFSDRPVKRAWEVDEWRMYADVNAAQVRGAAGVDRLFELVREAELIHGRLYASWVFTMVLCALRQDMHAQQERAWAIAGEHRVVAADVEFDAYFDWMLSGLALKRGHLDEAESLLESFQDWRDAGVIRDRERWAARMAHWSMATGDHAGALSYLRKQLGACQHAGRPVDKVVGAIERCEQALRSASRRRPRANATSRGEA